jgi:hypothetical protein
MTPPLRVPRHARAQNQCGGSAWPVAGEGAPFPSGTSRRLALHMLRHQHTRTSVPSTLAHHDVWTAPPHPRPRQDSKPALHRASRAARSARRLRHPHHQEATRASDPGGTCRRPGAQRPRLRARSARPRPGCRRRPGAQRAHAIGAERVARGGDGSQWLPCLAQRARSALAAPIARSAERETAIRLAARAPARSAHVIGAERAARGAALAEPAVPHCAL